MMLPLPPIPEAVALLEGMQGKQIRIDDYKVVALRAEFVDYDESHNNNVNTQQSHHQEDLSVLVRTEFRIHLPGKQRLANEADAVVMSLFLSFATGITYSFDDTIDDGSRLVFAKANGVLHSWPYFRTFALSSMAQMSAVGGIVALLPLQQALQMAGFPTGSEVAPVRIPASHSGL